MNQMQVRLQGRMDRREVVAAKQEELLADTGDAALSDTDKKQIELYRDELVEIDAEIEGLSADYAAFLRAEEKSKELRRAMIGSVDGVDANGDGIVYRDFYTFARDVVLTRSTSLAQKWVNDESELSAMQARLLLVKRTPANTLSGDVPGLIPDQHIAQIFQVISRRRPIVASARPATLERGRLSFPKITQRPLVAVQSTEKTEAGNQKMIVGMEESAASTYLGGGDLSWQALNWSTPDALQLWFDLAAESYADQTEADAAEVIEQAGFLNNISSTLGATPTYAQFVTTVAAGAGDVYANSNRMANTLYMAPDRFYYLAGLTTDVASPFGLNGRLSLVSQDGSQFGLNLVVSPGMDAGAMIVGDSQALICAESPNAPVELKAVEPAIGGLEVGIIGAFEAVVVEDEAFALITTAS